MIVLVTLANTLFTAGMHWAWGLDPVWVRLLAVALGGVVLFATAFHVLALSLPFVLIVAPKPTTGVRLMTWVLGTMFALSVIGSLIYSRWFDSVLQLFFGFNLIQLFRGLAAEARKQEIVYPLGVTSDTRESAINDKEIIDRFLSIMSRNDMAVNDSKELGVPVYRVREALENELAHELELESQIESFAPESPSLKEIRDNINSYRVLIIHLSDFKDISKEDVSILSCKEGDPIFDRRTQLEVIMKYRQQPTPP